MRRLAGLLVVFGTYGNVTLSVCMAINRLVTFKSRLLYARLFSPTRTSCMRRVSAVWSELGHVDRVRRVVLHVRVASEEMDLPGLRGRH